MIWRLLLAAAAVAAIIAWVMATDRDPGYVLIHYGPWSLETTLSLVTLGAAAAFLALHLALRLGGGLFRLPGRIGRWKRARRASRARARLADAVTAAAEGHLTRAMRLATEGVRHSEHPQLHLYTAAAAAHELGERELRDRHLHQAMELRERDEAAAGLLQARWWIEEGRHEQALATLLRLHERHPKLPRLDTLLARSHYALQDWGALRTLLPRLDPAPPIEWERATWLGLMEKYAEGNDPEGLRGVWKALPERLREEDEVVAAYVRRLMACEAAIDVENFLRRRLEERWSEALALLYGDLHHHLEVIPLLNQAEAWLKRHERDASLLLTAGRLALHARLWGKARGYLEASVALQPRLAGFRLLARTLEEMGDREALAACRRDALERL
ncbi:heme biosynthesis HemY N-terminal domain-containing protein [Endothiovibrio diazotrophicus]